MDRPKIFIGSTSEAADMAETLNATLRSWANSKVWTECFKIGDTTIEDVEKAIYSQDMCVFFWTGDDSLVIRGKIQNVPRGNLLFEAGMSLGKHGRIKTIVVKEENVEIPSDFIGITIIPLDPHRIFEIGEKIKTHWDNEFKQIGSKKQKKSEDPLSEETGPDVDKAERRQNNTGTKLIQKLEDHEYERRYESIKEELRKLKDKETADDLCEEDYRAIADFCMRIKEVDFSTYAIELLKYAAKEDSHSDKVIVDCINCLINKKRPRDLRDALTMCNSHFQISVGGENPVFTQASSSMVISDDGLLAIFNTYLALNKYQDVISLIDSLSCLGDTSQWDYLINSIKGYALGCLGSGSGIKILANVVKQVPQEKNLKRLADLYFSSSNYVKGYQILELLVCFSSNDDDNFTDSIINLVEKMWVKQCIRSERDTIELSFNEDVVRKAILPLLYLALEKKTDKETLSNVSKWVRRIQAKKIYAIMIEYTGSPDRVLDKWGDLQSDEKKFLCAPMRYIKENSERLSNIDVFRDELIRILSK